MGISGISWFLGFLLIGIAASQDCPANKTITDKSGNITSPLYPTKYPANQSCSWTIQAPPGKHIKLHFQTMNLENCGYTCVCDKLTMAIGRTSSQRKTEMCPYDIYKPNDYSKPYYSVFNTIWLTFYSDNSPSNMYKGFWATYEQIDYTPPDCPSDPVLLTESTGNISSPNYPNNYPVSRACYWLISVTAGPRVMLNFTVFQLEESGCQSSSYGNCNCDFVQVYDGETNATLAKLCDRTALPKPVISSSKKMLVKFFANDLDNFKGFHAIYTSTSEAATPTEAPAVTQGPAGTTGPTGGSSTTTAGLITTIMALVMLFTK